jgi:hypothetical protein
VDGPFKTNTKDAFGSGSGYQVSRQRLAHVQEPSAPRFSETSALILVVVPSLALWAMIWGAFVGISFVLRSLPGM